nr:unnamed protein product [Digitaria exilis]
MRHVRHPNIICIHEIMSTKLSIFVVMEFVTGGSLNSYLASGNGSLHEASTWCVLHQLVLTVDYYHSLGVYHCDIKPNNILIDATGNTIKVADFGLPTLVTDTLLSLSSTSSLLKAISGTPMFITPEVFLCRHGYDGAMADV